MKLYYGLDIGGTKIELAVFNQQLEKRYSKRIATPKDSYENWLNAIESLVREADLALGQQGSVGIGIPGFLIPETGLAETANIPVANGKPILADLTQRLGREVRIENDANCFALSEAWDSSNQNAATVLGVIIGTGVGAGLVFNGKVHSGRMGTAGEIGHTALNYHALTQLNALFGKNAPIYQCGCGQIACLDNYLSGRGFEQLYADLTGEKRSAPAIIEQFHTKEAQAVKFVDTFTHLMAASLATFITTLDPDLIVLGGGLSQFEYLYESVPALLPHYLMRGAKVPQMKAAIYGDAGGTRGAAALFLTE